MGALRRKLSNAVGELFPASQMKRRSHPPPIARLREKPAKDRAKRVCDDEHRVDEVQVRASLPLIRQLYSMSQYFRRYTRRDAETYG